jgi:hypothetical protein
MSTGIISTLLIITAVSSASLVVEIEWNGEIERARQVDDEQAVW